MSLLQTRKYFDDLAPRWDSLPGPPDAVERIARFTAQMDLARARRVLDVGCGTGILAPLLLDLLSPSAIVVELDFARAMLHEAARRVADDRVVHLCADARALPAQRATFDRVLCFNVLPHLGANPRACGELLRVLQPDGLLGVAHLMSSAELNAFHATLDPAVNSDHLPPAPVLAEILAQCGAVDVTVQEEPGWYFVRARRGAA